LGGEKCDWFILASGLGYKKSQSCGGLKKKKTNVGRKPEWAKFGGRLHSCIEKKKSRRIFQERLSWPEGGVAKNRITHMEPIKGFGSHWNGFLRSI